MISSDIVVLRPAAQNVPPGVALPAGPQGLPGLDGASGPQGLPGKDGATPDISGKLDATSAALLMLLDSLPVLPSDPASYPSGGGLFRDGDANGYRLVRILPAS